MPMLLVGLAWQCDPGETMRSFRVEEGRTHVSGWRRQGLGLILERVHLKRSDLSVGLSALPMREILLFQEVSCRRPWFALRPARQHWSQCCSPVALSSGSNDS